MFFFNSKKRNKNASELSPVQTTAPSSNPAPAQSNSANALLQSPYYNQYKSAFDQILWNGNQPKYKIDWLLQSLDMGHSLEIDGFYILESMKKGLPYFCETEEEFDKFFVDQKSVLRGSVDGMLDLGFYYSCTQPHSEKMKYWQQRLRKMADQGNHLVQGALCGNMARQVFSETEADMFRAQYQADLVRLADAGNPEAQLAAGKYLSPYQSPEALEWIRKAAEQGLTDAWYELGQAYEHSINFDEHNQFRGGSLSQETVEDLMKKAVACYCKGAQANNGVMAAWCQYRVGGCYVEGTSGLERDLEKAKYWYQAALKNGEESASGQLEYIEALQARGR